MRDQFPQLQITESLTVAHFIGLDNCRATACEISADRRAVIIVKVAALWNIAFCSGEKLISAGLRQKDPLPCNH